MPKVQGSLIKCKFPGCDYRNKYPYGIKKHERVHYPEAERPHGCRFCKFRASSPARLKRHLVVHSEQMPYICSVFGCQFKSKHRGCLRSHEKWIHSSAEVEVMCSYEGCDFKTKHRGNLKRHVADCHSKTREKGTECPLCAKSFFTIERMRTHLKTHTNEKPWRCSMCNFEAKSKLTLARHVEACDGDLSGPGETSLYKCTYCDFTTRFRCGLNRHLPSHAQDGPYACTLPDCSFQAKRTDTLRNHMAAHGSNQHPCSVEGCTYLAKNAGTLYYHSTKHHLPFPCVFTDCKARFSTEVALVSHQKFHDPDRPHQCESCSRRFKKAFQLNQHIRYAHEKAQRFQCPHCNYCTSNRYRRSTHMKNVHRMEEVNCSEPGCSFRS